MQYKLKIKQFENEASCIFDSFNKISNCSIELDEENDYCKNINRDIVIEETISNNYIIVDNSIIHFYGYENLATYTVEAGELNRGNCYGNIYQFNFTNSMVYNDLYNEKEITFSVNLIGTGELSASCILPYNLANGSVFDIGCSIIGTNKCPIIPPDKDLIINENNPDDIISGIKRVNFRNFSKKLL